METVPPVCSLPSLSLSPELRTFFPLPSLHKWRAHGVELSTTAESIYSQGFSLFPLNLLYTCWVFFHASYCDTLGDVVILGNMKELVHHLWHQSVSTAFFIFNWYSVGTLKQITIPFAATSCTEMISCAPNDLLNIMQLYYALCTEPSSVWFFKVIMSSNIG